MDLSKRKETTMKVAIHVTYFVRLEDEDAGKLESGEISPSDIDWSYYVEEATEIELDYVDVF